MIGGNLWYPAVFCVSGVVPLSKLRSCGVPKQN